MWSPAPLALPYPTAVPLASSCFLNNPGKFLPQGFCILPGTLFSQASAWLIPYLLQVFFLTIREAYSEHPIKNCDRSSVFPYLLGVFSPLMIVICSRAQLQTKGKMSTPSSVPCLWLPPLSAEAPPPKDSHMTVTLLHQNSTNPALHLVHSQWRYRHSPFKKRITNHPIKYYCWQTHLKSEV